MKSLAPLALALGLVAGAAAAQQTVRLGTEGAYPPYNFINEANEVAGFERDFGDEVCLRAGLTCEWVVNDWDSIIPNLLSGNYDVIIAGMTITEARRDVIAFSLNYLPPEPSAFIAMAGAGEGAITGLVAAQANTVQAAHVAESGATLMEFATPEEIIAAVRNGQADAAMAEREFLAPFVEAAAGAIEFVGENVFIGDGIGLGLRQSDGALLAALDAAILSMREDGTLNAMITRWFGDEAALFD